MQILICDDDALFAQKLQQLLQAQCQVQGLQKVQFVTLWDAAQMEQLELSQIDLAFLDVDMPEPSGFTLARRLMRANPRAVLLFVTNYVQHAPAGFEVGAFRYLMKEQLEEKLAAYFSAALIQYRKLHGLLCLTIHGERQELDILELIYVEAVRHDMLLHFAGRAAPLKLNTTMAFLEEQLQPLGFLRTHKSYLVNMAYIRQLQYGSLTLTTGKELRASERSYAQITNCYLTWKGKALWNIF